MLQWQWEMAPCAISVLACMAAAVYVIWRYEGPGGGENHQRRPAGVVYDDEAWRPCFRSIHPGWLMLYRFTCSALFGTLAVLGISRQLLYYYTEWTLLLVTTYFWLATGMSVYGCRKFDPEKNLSLDGQGDTRKVSGFWGYLLQVVYQTTAGAVMLTDAIFWLILFPHNIRLAGYHITFWNVMAHSFNVIFLLGDVALNSMSYPWFRMGYFFLWTCAYVLFQWTVHALSVITWWPYPFLDLSSHLAPLWYIVAGLLQVPCYLAFTVALILKRRLFSKWAPATFIQT